MRRFFSALVLSVCLPTFAMAGHGVIDRLCFSAASPGYPCKEFWAPRLYRLHASHWPVSVDVCPPTRTDAMPGYMPVGPYCNGSQPHFPVAR